MKMKAFFLALVAAFATCVVSLPTKSKLSQEELRASLITKDNVAEYLQNQRRKKAMEQAKLPEPFVIRLLESIKVKDVAVCPDDPGP